MNKENPIYGILTMSDNYEQRVVANTKEDDWEVDTAMVTDRSWTYETAVRHPKFRQNNWIVVEGTNSKEEAEQIHEEWVERMGNKPKMLLDIFEHVRYNRI